jgi:peroxiredoxin
MIVVMPPARLASLLVAAALVAVIGVKFVGALGPAVDHERRTRVDKLCMPLTPTPANSVFRSLPTEAPDFEAQDFTGKTVKLSAYRGKVVLLNFWASWCPPCVEEMPAMETLARRLGGTDFVILAVSSDESWQKIREFFAEGTAMTVLWDPSAAKASDAKAEAGLLSRRYGTDKLPESYLIDRDGRIRYYIVNTRDWSTPDAERCVRGLLKE